MKRDLRLAVRIDSITEVSATVTYWQTLNGEPLYPETQAILAPGDIVDLKYTFEVTRELTIDGKPQHGE